MIENKPWFKFWPKDVPRHIDYPEIPLFECLAETAKKHPDNIAFSCGERSLTFKELDLATSKLAAALDDLGMKRGDSAVLFLPNSLEFVIGYYGILKVGGTVSPANPLYKGDELKHQLNDSAATVIITTGDLYPVVKKIKSETKLKNIVLVDAEQPGEAVSLQGILAEYSPTAPVVELDPEEQTAAIEYTGGTTGLPKGAMLTHYNLLSNAIQNAAWFGWTSEDVIAGLLPFYHSWGACACVNSPIYTGARVIILPRFNTESLLETIEKERITVLYGAVSLFIMLANSPLIDKYDLSSLKYVKAGAMPIPPEVKERWERITGVKMILGYGLSEASPETHNSPPQRVSLGTIGIPIMDTDAKIVDQETGKTDLPLGEVGELVIKGPQIMKGYLNRPEENKDALRNGWLHTGDLALMTEEGYFKIVDRKKETIKYKGYTIAPAEVEAAIYEHPAVKECAVVGKPDALAGEIPKAFVVLRDGHTSTEDELITFCAQKVAPYKKIRIVEFIEEIPKTPVGKVLRRILRDRERNL